MRSTWVLGFLISVGCTSSTWAASVARQNKRPMAAVAKPARPVQSQPIADESALEKDLENVKTGEFNLVENQNIPANNDPEMLDPSYGTVKEDDLDIQLLYDLIRAVEYEANAELFDQVLKDLDIANYPAVPVETESKPAATGQSATSGEPGKQQNTGNAVEMRAPQNANLAPRLLRNQGASMVSDNRGKSMVQRVPANVHVPLHKRLSAVLSDVPGSQPLLPKDGLAEKRNMKRGKP